MHTIKTWKIPFIMCAPMANIETLNIIIIYYYIIIIIITIITIIIFSSSFGESKCMI